MNLSYHEIIDLIRKEQAKHEAGVKDKSAQANRGYSRDAFFAMRDFEKVVRKYFAKKYP